jgi:hypothetical protein
VPDARANGTIISVKTIKTDTKSLLGFIVIPVSNYQKSNCRIAGSALFVTVWLGTNFRSQSNIASTENTPEVFFEVK